MRFKGTRDSTPIGRLRAKKFADKDERNRLVLRVFDSGQWTVDDVLWFLDHGSSFMKTMGVKLLRATPPKQLVAYLAPAKERPKPDTVRRLLELAKEGWQRELASQLRSRDVALREAAREVLLHCPTSCEGISALLRVQLAKASPKDQKRIISKLVAEPTPEALAALSLIANSKSTTLRKFVLQEARKVRQASLVRLIAPQLGSTSEMLRDLAHSVLESYVEAGIGLSPHIADTICGQSSLTRRDACKLALTAPDALTSLGQVAQKLQTVSAWIRREVLSALATVGDSTVGLLMQLAENEGAEYRSFVADLASYFEPSPELTDLLLLLLEDPDWWIRLDAVEALGQIGGEGAIKGLVQALDDPDTQLTAVDSLVGIGTAKAAEALLSVLPTADLELQMELVRGLGQFGNRSGARALGTILRQSYPEQVQAEAKFVLMSLQEQISRDNHVQEETGQSQLLGLLQMAAARGASDVHIGPGFPPTYRKRGDLMAFDSWQDLEAHESASLLSGMLTDDQAEELGNRGQLEFCAKLDQNWRCRANLFADRVGLNGTFRLIPARLTNIDSLNLDLNLPELLGCTQGLILVTGSAGSGKTTTMAALVEHLNQTRRAHIVTLEQPIEYLFEDELAVVTQRQIGRDSQSLMRALRAALREDPDIIVIGEMRTPEVIRLALESAETGHLVLATMNAPRAAQAVEQVINSFAPEEQGQARRSVADSLRAVIAQALLPAADESRIPVLELLVGLPTVSSVIRDGRIVLLSTIMQTGRELGMRSMSDSLSELVAAGRLEEHVAAAFDTRLNE